MNISQNMTMWNVIGQPEAISSLERNSQQGRLSHAYLFVGPPHVGKRTLAITLAQSVNCKAQERPCTSCDACRRILEEKHPDVQILGLDSKHHAEIGIHYIREIQATSYLPPFEGRYKVFIIQNAEALSSEASNCLLKILEEPSPQVLFLLLSSRERQLLPTITSRCQRIELRPSPVSSIKTMLILSLNVEEDKAETISKLSKGRPGWALQAVSNEHLINERIQNLNSVVAIGQAHREQRLAQIGEIALRYSKDRSRIDDMLCIWADWWRDIMLVRTKNNQFITNVDFMPTLIQEAEKYNLCQISKYLRNLQTAREQLEQNVNPRLLLENLVLGLPNS
ncbi:MAG: DNA polymerase III subunit delta' [Chloroflexota bacterium]|nr:DNA polymerase III subunit delta' [Chloroflexota bacterium]